MRHLALNGGLHCPPTKCFEGECRHLLGLHRDLRPQAAGARYLRRVVDPADHGVKIEILSRSTKFPLAPRGDEVIVSYMAKHDPELSLLFHALADETRRSMLSQLAQGPARVTDLAGPTGLSLPTVMRHLSVLEEAGLIATSKDGRVRTCAIVPEAMDPVRTWIDEQRAIWEARLDRLDKFVMNVMKERET